MLLYVYMEYLIIFMYPEGHLIIYFILIKPYIKLMAFESS